MPAKSKSQQRLMGMAYAYKTGELKSKDLDKDYAKEIKKLANSMTKTQLEDFAKTKHKGLPNKKNESRILDFNSFENTNESRILDFFRRRNRQEEVVEEPETESDPDLNLPDELKDMFMETYRNGFNWKDIEEFAHYCYGYYKDDPQILKKIVYLMPSIPGSIFIGELEKQGIKIEP